MRLGVAGVGAVTLVLAVLLLDTPSRSAITSALDLALRLPPTADVVVSVPIGSSGTATDFVLLRDAQKSGPRPTYFFLPPFIQSDNVETSGPEGGPLTFTIELLPVFPEKARVIFVEAFAPGPSGMADLFAAAPEYLRVSIPELSFSRTYRRGRMPPLIPGVPLRFNLSIPAEREDQIKLVRTLLDNRALRVVLDFGWGPLVEKRQTVSARGYDFYVNTPPYLTLKNNVRVFDRERFEIAASALVKRKLPQYLELDVVDVILDPAWRRTIDSAFIRVTPDDLRSRYGVSDSDIQRLPTGRDLLISKHEDGRSVLTVALKTFLDREAFPLGELIYRDTDRTLADRPVPVGRELKLGWAPADDPSAWALWLITSRETKKVFLEAPRNCSSRTPVILVPELLPGQRLRVSVNSLSVSGMPNLGSRLKAPREDQIPVVLQLENRTRVLAGPGAELIAAERGPARLVLDPQDCERKGGLSVNLEVNVEIAR